MNYEVPVSIAIFFVGLILLVRFALPRWQDTKSLRREVDTLCGGIARLVTTCGEITGTHSDLAKRLSDCETNIKTLHGNLVSVRDGAQLRSALRP